MSTVHANLLIAANGATTLGGRSAPLSSGSDRERFHALRALADLIIIGGATARIEPYEKTPCELVVITRGDDLGRAATNPLAQITHQSIAEVIRAATSQGSTVLIEAGVSLLLEATQSHHVDLLHITRTERLGDGDFVDESELFAGFTLESEQLVASERFQQWRACSSN